MTSHPTALIIVDVQTCFTHPADNLDPAAVNTDLTRFFELLDAELIPNLQRLLEAFRHAVQPVYFTEMGSLRSDGADLPSALRAANAVSRKQTGSVVIPPLDDDTSRTDARIAPRADEIVFRKTTTGTLASTPLASNLRALGCRDVVVSGIVTDCCVSQTARELADQDFAVTLAGDGCASYAPEHHVASLEIFANYYGSVDSCATIAARFTDPAASAG